ncbi:growth inhibitor PemK [Corynebacterium sp. sy017]|uniref:type II toxin-antitoxin system PemK/MazF family toxin n=1 Tax=unclassified Corynebacterium TaxID=2624378 RepID=UPI0011868313|nr:MULTISPECIES: type II toxin-antitoxin system PemK/MazF family toxin [unclassified Corynebacterium]MBP3088105.1 growth inhibitor PemK [Corynebacterium sp. sy017]TSD92628.1 growth inhibitor PemK [Corynebacterium sp. SY003]
MSSKFRVGSQLKSLWAKNKTQRGTKQNPLDTGLSALNERLGLHKKNHSPVAEHNVHKYIDCQVSSSSECARNIIYAPDMDGQVDPGEIVWFFAPTNKKKERALVVIARHGAEVLGLLTSSNPEHDKEDSWLDIGVGPWDESGKQNWVRLDKIIRVPEIAIRRQGAIIPRSRFERIANRLRAEYGWI